MSYYDPATDNIKSIWMGLTFCGKTLDEVARGIKLSLYLCVGTGRKMHGSTVDSGGGTPESFGRSCNNINICADEASHQSCGLHDIQSKFRLPMQHCVGEGGLLYKNTVQFLHTLNSLFDKN